MTTLFILCEQTTNYTETIIISIVASGIFGLITFFLGRLYDRLTYIPHVATYHRLYKRDKQELLGEIAAIATVDYRGKGELIINVVTLINEIPDNSSNDYKFPKENIQEWQAIVTMENEEAGKLYFYYLRPDDLRNEKRSHFKRVLFLHNFRYLKFFGDGIHWGEELFDKI